MLATATTLPKDSSAHVFEAKWDGIRAMARVDGTAELFSRHATNLSSLGVTVSRPSPVRMKRVAQQGYW
jgi:ATP-dependent DNA ligase